MREPLFEYELRLDERRSRLRAAESQMRTLAHLRLATFGLAALWVWWVFRTPSWDWTLGLLPIPPFGLLVIQHERVSRIAARARRAVRYYELARDRLDLIFAGSGQSGERYLTDPEHPYLAHLDLFGTGSLFELMSQAQTRAGEDKLASWLSAPAGVPELRERHAAVRELRELLDLREDLGILGPEIDRAVEADRLLAWGASEAYAVPRQTRILAASLVATTLLAGVLALFDWVSWLPFLFALLTEIVFSLRWRLWVRGVLRDTDRMAQELSLLGALMRRIENEDFSSRRLVDLRARLETDGVPPSEQIERLRKLVELLDARRNQMFALLAPLLMWTTQISFAIAAWRQACGPALEGWLDGIAEIEALCDLATYAYERPDDVFPEWAEQGPVFEAEGIGHPLIQPSQCVRNDIVLDSKRALYVVSGSNMSGKSTFLRAIGTNLVLAFAGAPVCARRFTVSPLALGASIRILDSLRDGSSRFYAEIQALRRVVRLTQDELPVLFLLDEILSGTNSHDRGIGAAAVVRQLLGRGAIGLLTTHDLALSKICDEWGDRAGNVHFEDTVVDGKMRFDYRLRAGVVEKSNALALMRSVGLDVGE